MGNDLDSLDDIFADEASKKARPVGKFQPKAKFQPQKIDMGVSVIPQFVLTILLEFPMFIACLFRTRFRPFLNESAQTLVPN
ncbi:hypothetical protein ACS0TY_009405 [Phlomoides rotata]